MLAANYSGHTALRTFDQLFMTDGQLLLERAITVLLVQFTFVYMHFLMIDHCFIIL